ncbi:MAG: hypothetical protein AAGD22_09760 [Verrucomicrobiota bacterium]
MKIRILSLTLVTAAVAAFLFPFLGSQNIQAQEEKAVTPPSGHQLWEYRALRIQDRRQSGSLNRDIGAREAQSEDTLNLLGAKGWELVAIRNDGSTEPVFYFKRPKKN